MPSIDVSGTLLLIHTMNYPIYEMFVTSSCNCSTGSSVSTTGTTVDKQRIGVTYPFFRKKPTNGTLS